MAPGAAVAAPGGHSATGGNPNMFDEIQALRALDGDAARARLGAMLNLSGPRSEEHTSELQSLMRISYAVFCLKKITQHTHTKTTKKQNTTKNTTTEMHRHHT